MISISNGACVRDLPQPLPFSINQSNKQTNKEKKKKKKKKRTYAHVLNHRPKVQADGAGIVVAVGGDRNAGSAKNLVVGGPGAIGQAYGWRLVEAFQKLATEAKRASSRDGLDGGGLQIWMTI